MAVSCYTPPRERPGFGCPHCGGPLPTSSRALLLSLMFGLKCCGYFPKPEETIRWSLAGRVIADLDGV